MLKRKPGTRAALREGSLHSQFITHQYFRLLKDIQDWWCSLLCKVTRLWGIGFPGEGESRQPGSQLCSEGNGVRWMCTMLQVQELINLSISLFCQQYGLPPPPHWTILLTLPIWKSPPSQTLLVLLQLPHGVMWFSSGGHSWGPRSS